ncbi:MAG: prolyl oligopeptidase family serine peptidase [Brumimicrobium sp.]|nr:prolyl oligopeptidase family serine peptidase [Brumimicrobium sp.]MCO5269647.1 prolyl oligopeptidase family serine peptidase [Brumimicrobium sp.]
MKRFIFIGIILTTLLVSCKKEKYVDVAPGTLIESKEIKTITKSECISLIDSVDASGFATYDVQLLEVVYASTYQGKTIETSGMLFVPVGIDTFNLVTYCHGTVAPADIMGKKWGTPSQFKGEKFGFIESRNVGLSWATAGYTVFMPDYIGYGRTKKVEHPYVYYPELVNAIYDGTIAVKKYLLDQSAYYENKLFLAGYSQGGGASFFSHWYIDTYHSSEFNVTASLNLSGPYHIKRILQTIIEHKDEKQANIGVYAWALYSINKFSELKRPNDYFFSYPVYDQGSSFLPPSKVPSKILNNFFMQQIQNGKDKEMIKVLERCWVAKNWYSPGKIYLYHGDQDDFVPYFNSEDAYTTLSQNGVDVQFFTYTGKKHWNVLKPFITDAKNQLDALK